ncbi:TraR/DksA family transcriptional regulator [Microbacterium caowuchunii]|uniref:TraR/DksA family transcriptional regulator n=1 Tax=Microbacterium caowuchunii TaxID=2614638 RepID=A0A5N0TEU7_9MICO|nr:TraR/DksA C4-type zinc finger protein [Microbacterium caowuchunii]KAA9132984.1 TraR/DksA family transcriptional regulator [Microbacterium caowuchunii]
MTTQNPELIASSPHLDTDAIRRSLEEHLKEREDIIRELAPQAAPNVDPVAWTTTAGTRRVMDQIRAALERLDAGTYGNCLRCGEAVAPGRLEVLPYAETCIACQAASERA